MRSSYGSTYSEDDVDATTELSPILKDLPRREDPKRWSVIDKLSNRHYCSIRNCDDLRRAMTWKSLLSTAMLAAFVLLAYSMVKVLFLVGQQSSRHDFIIVGAGPSGSLLARRLADTGASVLLLEAGGPTQYSLGGKDSFGGPVTRFDIPLLWPAVSRAFSTLTGGSELSKEFVSSDFTWPKIKSMPDVILGKGLGGCGILNAMIYIRALPNDFETWNITGWTWEKVLSIYKHNERFQVHHMTVPDELDSAIRKFNETPETFHGYSGMFATDRNYFEDPMSELVIRAALRAGIPYTLDFNNPSRSTSRILSEDEQYLLSNGRLGVGRYHFNVANGTRQSVAHVMLGSLLKPRYYAVSSTDTESPIVHQDNKADITPKSSKSPGNSGNPSGKEGGTATSNTNDLPSPLSDNLYIRVGATARRIILQTDSALNSKSLSIYRHIQNNKVQTDEAFDDISQSLRILNSKRAIGVEYEKDGAIQTAYLRRPNLRGASKPLHIGVSDPNLGVFDYRSVIVTAGAISTPKLLINSGIGAAEDLRALNIPVEIDSPQVGKHLYDHPVVAVVYRIDPKSLLFPYPSAYNLPLQWNHYVQSVERSLSYNSRSRMSHRKLKNSSFFERKTRDSNRISPYDFGIWGSTGFDTGIFLRSPYSTHIKDASVPDIQITIFPNVVDPGYVDRHDDRTDASEPSGDWSWADILGSSGDDGTDIEVDDPHIAYKPPNYIEILVTVALLDPEGHYEVTVDDLLPTANPPVIKVAKSGNARKARDDNHSIDQDKEYLTELDVRRLRWGVRELRRIFSFEPLNHSVVKEFSPGEEIQSDEDLSSWIHENNYANSHWTGTAPMGNSGQQSCKISNEFTDPIYCSVVDENLRVRGSNNLYVADASAIPHIPNGNVHSTVTIVASMAAEYLIKKYYYFTSLM